MSVESLTLRPSRDHRRVGHDRDSRILFGITFAACLSCTLLARLVPLQREGRDTVVKRSILDEAREAASSVLVGYSLLR